MRHPGDAIGSADRNEVLETCLAVALGAVALGAVAQGIGDGCGTGCRGTGCGGPGYFLSLVALAACWRAAARSVATMSSNGCGCFEKWLWML